MRDRGRALRSVPVPAESALFKPFIAEPKSRSIPGEHLDAGARGVAEDEEMPAGGIHPEAIGDDAVETIETLAHVRGAGNDEDAGGGGERDHKGDWAGFGASNERSSAIMAGWPWMVTGPKARWSSRRMAPGVSEVGSAKSSTRWGASRTTGGSAARAR